IQCCRCQSWPYMCSVFCC
nr:Chain A, ILE-GLN-CYS-CYS-ARG-CYS-GLN-SER-TRP-PRO-TYR-MET-CYS-SER-VAL-PHE-CYS-CYS [Schisandra chinensis]